MSKEKLTAEMIGNYLEYNPDTGLLTHKRERRRIKAGDIAGCVSNRGYIKIGLLGMTFQAHRIAWLLHYGEWPTNPLDHINGNRTDNRIDNLRMVDNLSNLQNQKHPLRNNRVGLRGVCIRHGKYMATIVVDRKQKFLGLFETKEEASAVYWSAKKQFHKGYTHEQE